MTLAERGARDRPTIHPRRRGLHCVVRRCADLRRCRDLGSARGVAVSRIDVADELNGWLAGALTKGSARNRQPR